MSDTASAPPPPAPRRPVRAIASWVALVLAAVFLLLTAFAVWVDRVALNTDVFEDTSSALIEDDAIRQAVATRAVDELFTNVDVDAEVKAQLPANYKSLSGPAAAGLREASYTLVARALEQPRFQRLWSTALAESHRTLVEVLEGDGDTVGTEGGVVTLDLETIVLEAADRIGIRDRVEDELPEDVGNIEILRSDDLDTAQDTFTILNALAWLLPLLTIALFALAVWLAGDRRRAVRRIGVALLLVGVLGLVAANLAGTYLVNELVSDTESRTAAGNAWDIVTVLLRDSFRTMVAIGHPLPRRRVARRPRKARGRRPPLRRAGGSQPRLGVRGARGPRPRPPIRGRGHGLRPLPARARARRTRRGLDRGHATPDAARVPGRDRAGCHRRGSGPALDVVEGNAGSDDAGARARCAPPRPRGAPTSARRSRPSPNYTRAAS